MLKKTQYKGGLRDRRTDAKGRTIYEWDIFHGEPEALSKSADIRIFPFNRPGLRVCGESTWGSRPR
ncbi:colicin E3/pyocin S6 family cytotoxin [Pseudomonas sp. GR 6-02]|uniref:colicin E3/pyocin S6 family cytotoxin n=1 Tax=Pseudomonas sp. GR 6-02 TaxID=1659194 RepID=UPI001F17B605|nr:colicin E3/pyocin S6 family cytotoxin [Pseudomonas sp. GR 6-02]